jgi:hypothetical protein
MFMMLFLTQLIHAVEPVCADHYSQLEKTESLKTLQSVLPVSGVKGFVNKTRGSYFFIRSTEDKLKLTFLTTGLFDLYGIRRDSEIRFCDSEGQLYILGMGGIQKIVLKENFILLKGDSPVHTFESGDVPALLREKNDLSDLE